MILMILHCRIPKKKPTTIWIWIYKWLRLGWGAEFKLIYHYLPGLQYHQISPEIGSITMCKNQKKKKNQSSMGDINHSCIYYKISTVVWQFICSCFCYLQKIVSLEFTFCMKSYKIISLFKIFWILDEIRCKLFIFETLAKCS